MRKGKRENMRESVIGPQGAGPCARVKEYCTGNLGRTGGPSQPITRLLESHVVLGVVLWGLSIVHEERKSRLQKKDRPSELTRNRNKLQEDMLEC